MSSATAAKPPGSHLSVVRLRLQSLEEGGWLGRSPDVPGLNVQADTVEEVLSLAPLLIQDLVDFWNDVGTPLPPALAATSDVEAIDLSLAVEVANEVSDG